MAPRPDETASGEPLLTRYRIFTTDDGGLTLRYLGFKDAKSSEDALRTFLPADAVGAHSAISENSVKLRNLKPRPGPIVETEPLPWPEIAETPPVQTALAD